MRAPLPDRQGPKIEATFRNGSLTAISVILGFSLSFLVRWSALPGPWTRFDLLSVALLTLGVVLQIVAVAALLFTSSLDEKLYNRAVGLFLAGLGIVALGTGLAIAGDVLGGGGKEILGRPVQPQSDRRSGPS